MTVSTTVTTIDGNQIEIEMQQPYILASFFH